MKSHISQHTNYLRPVVLICLVITILGLSTACQNAPATDKTATAAPERSAETTSTSALQPLELPGHVLQAPTKIANLELEIDADVTSPEGASFLLLEVEPHIFAESEIQAIGETAAGITNLELYSQYEPGRAYWERKLSEAVEFGTASSERIEYLEQMLNEAPEQDAKTMFDGTVPSNSNSQTDLYFENGTEIGRLTFFPGGNQMGFERDMSESFLPESIMDSNSGEVIRDEPIISEEEARREAEAFRDRFAPELTEVAVEPCLIKNSSGRGPVTGWYFAFTRPVGGLQKSFSMHGYYINPESAPTLAAPWEPERLTITVDDRGIVALMWTGASEPTGSEPEIATLLPFSDIQQQAITQLGYMYGPMETSQGLGLELTITNFSLGTEMLAAADDPATGVYTPVWAVRYNYSSGEDGDISHEQIFLDAQNGRYVEPRVTTAYLMEYQ
ncbi:MAG: hypothetical protein HDQ87_07650 [Clostridia bacterium]|nr:hypothetical protein [Clostridia bacterium]